MSHEVAKSMNLYIYIYSMWFKEIQSHLLFFREENGLKVEALTFALLAFQTSLTYRSYLDYRFICHTFRGQFLGAGNNLGAKHLPEILLASITCMISDDKSTMMEPQLVIEFQQFEFRNSWWKSESFFVQVVGKMTHTHTHTQFQAKQNQKIPTWCTPHHLYLPVAGARQMPNDCHFAATKLHMHQQHVL